jgi:hypothetical protein
MAVMPLFKFGVLAIRTLSKPVANSIKRRCIDHPRFRNGCISFAQWWHRMEVNFHIRLLGYEAKAVQPLSEEKAVQQGAEVLGEGIIFGIAASLLLIENFISSRKEEAKRKALDALLQSHKERIVALEDAFAVLQKDAFDLMAHGGSIAHTTLTKRKEAERQRVDALRQLRAEKGETGLWERAVYVYTTSHDATARALEYAQGLASWGSPVSPSTTGAGGGVAGGGGGVGGGGGGQVVAGERAIAPEAGGRADKRYALATPAAQPAAASQSAAAAAAAAAAATCQAPGK